MAPPYRSAADPYHFAGEKSGPKKWLPRINGNRKPAGVSERAGGVGGFAAVQRGWLHRKVTRNPLHEAQQSSDPPHKKYRP
jgi:hypothetical protein